MLTLEKKKSSLINKLFLKKLENKSKIKPKQVKGNNKEQKSMKMKTNR